MTELTFTPDDHRYYLNNVELPSVTRILADMGFVDTGYFTPESAQRGTYVHRACELDDTGELDEASLDAVLRPYVDAWRAFKTESGITIDLIEKPVASEIYRFAGTVDRTGTVFGEPALLDIKSGAVQSATALQTAAYEIALGGKLKRYAVRLMNTGKYKLHPYVDRQDRQIFLSAVACWHWRKNNGGRK